MKSSLKTACFCLFVSTVYKSGASADCATSVYGVSIEARFDGEKEETRSTAEERPALTEPAFLSRAKGFPTWCALGESNSRPTD